MWKRLALGAALLLVLGGGIILIEESVIGGPLAEASNKRATRNTAARPNPTSRRRHRRHRRVRRGNKNM